jgi:hypothetical protein
LSQLKLTIVGDPTPLRNATKVAETSLRKMSKVADTVGRKMNSTFAAVGLTVGLTALTNGLKNATKAASDDRKSQGLLANALKNTVGANADAIAGAEAYVKRTQLSSAVLDDELRPALASAVRATGSLSKGQRILDIALDISASTGKDLGSVTGALSKAFNGQTGALKKLVPGLKMTGDVIANVETQFQGASETAANLDPYKRLEIIFSDIQETIGEALLPALEDFAAYLITPEGERNLQIIVDAFVNIAKTIGFIITLMVENIDLVIMLGIQVLLIKGYFVALNVIIGLTQAGIIKATTALKLMRIALVSTGIGAAIALVGTLAGAWLEAAEAKEDYEVITPGTPTEGLFSGPGIDPNTGASWISMGFNSFEEYLADLKAKKAKIVFQAKDLADKVRKALDSKIDAMKKTAEKFRDAVGIATGSFGKDEYSIFDVDFFKAKLQNMLNASKGFASNLKKILDVDPSGSINAELVAMGPAAGNIAAKALLASGDLKEIVGMRTSLYNTGAQAGAQQAIAGNATYEININKAVISASDIIKEIRLLEKKTGRKYLVGS